MRRSVWATRGSEAIRAAGFAATDGGANNSPSWPSLEDDMVEAWSATAGDLVRLALVRLREKSASVFGFSSDANSGLRMLCWDRPRQKTAIQAPGRPS